MKSLRGMISISLGSLLLIAVLLGLTVPQIYDWTGQDQSYHSPRTTCLMIAVPVIAIVFSLSMIWWPKPDESKPPVRFNVRLLLALTALVAVSLVAIPFLPLIPSVAVCVAGYGYAVWLARDVRHRLAVISFLGCALRLGGWFRSSLGYQSARRRCASGIPALNDHRVVVVRLDTSREPAAARGFDRAPIHGQPCDRAARWAVRRRSGYLDARLFDLRITRAARNDPRLINARNAFHPHADLASHCVLRSQS